MREQCGRHLHAGNATKIGRRRKAGEITDDAAAERHDRAAAVDAGIDQAIVDERQPREVLVLLAVRNLDDRGIEAGGGERRHRRSEIEFCDRRVGHHRHPFPTPRLREPRSHISEAAGSDVDRIRAFPQLYVDDFHRSGRASACWISLTT